MRRLESGATVIELGDNDDEIDEVIEAAGGANPYTDRGRPTTSEGSLPTTVRDIFTPPCDGALTQSHPGVGEASSAR